MRKDDIERIYNVPRASKQYLCALARPGNIRVAAYDALLSRGRIISHLYLKGERTMVNR
jgi:hypothetical protein